MAFENFKESMLSWGKRGTAGATIAGRITFENVSRMFSGVHVINNVSLDIAPGEIVCLLGPSGCGKTTLLRLAAGIERPDHGRILLNDQEVSGPNKFVLPEKRSVGLMFQDFALFPHLRILDNVTYGLQSLNRQEAKQVAKAILERVGLSSYAEDFPHILSGGEQQRIALARAIAPRPSILLMDEPFSGLDPRLRESMRTETLAILRETRSTCIIVTHQPEEAIRMGDRIVIMNKGRIIQSANSKDLYYKPRNLFVARMLSGMNELNYAVVNGQIETPLGALDAGHIETGTDVIVAIRHSDIRLTQSPQAQIGRVLTHQFLGDMSLLELAVHGFDLPLLARLRRDEAALPGQEIRVTLDANAPLIFAADQDHINLGAGA
ncbi:MAG: ABC transporter ATP-binding protein [Pseudomonadota bacterium]